MDDTSEALRARHRAAGDRMIESGRRFLRLLEQIELERKFNRFWLLQPRVPAGQPDGGQWTDGGVTLANSAGQDFRVSLRYNDIRYRDVFNGAHTSEKHVGISDIEMLRASESSERRTIKRMGVITIEEIWYEQQGSFESIDEAQKFINDALQSPNHKARMQEWIKGSKMKTQIDYESEKIVGRITLRDPDGVYRVYPTHHVRIVIRRDPANPRAFYVQTAFPTMSSEGKR